MSLSYNCPYLLKTAMKIADITDPVFRRAVAAIDAGNVAALQRLLANHPQLVRKRLEVPAEGYFSHPYLLWFIADNPIRTETLPANIVEIAQLLIQSVQQQAPDSFQQQLDYTLGLVVTGRIPRECGVQLALMDVLLDAGALPGNGHGALAHGNREAAQHLLERGGELTLLAAICLNRTGDIRRLAEESTVADRQAALIAAAFYGKADWLDFLIRLGVDVNGHIDTSSGFHSHATALHQAVYSGSLEAVKTLVEAGANLDAEDRIYQGTPLGWVIHMQADKSITGKYARIETFLRQKRIG